MLKCIKGVGSKTISKIENAIGDNAPVMTYEDRYLILLRNDYDFIHLQDLHPNILHKNWEGLV
jgi:hypothetical protein